MVEEYSIHKYHMLYTIYIENSVTTTEDITSLIADIMSDPTAREKEFGLDSVLNFPYQTAVKTGTSDAN